MTSPDERREVAERLREKHIERTHRFEGQCVEDQRVQFLRDLNDCLPDGDSAFLMLADLIDPAGDNTTFTLDEQSKDGEEVYPTRWWKCARCGEETIMMYDEGAPVACPYCGARVTSGGER